MNLLNIMSQVYNESKLPVPSSQLQVFFTVPIRIFYKFHFKPSHSIFSVPYISNPILFPIYFNSQKQSKRPTPFKLRNHELVTKWVFLLSPTSNTTRAYSDVATQYKHAIYKNENYNIFGVQQSIINNKKVQDDASQPIKDNKQTEGSVSRITKMWIISMKIRKVGHPLQQEYASDIVL